MRPVAVCLDAAGTLFTERTSRAAMYAQALDRHGTRADPRDVGRWMSEAHDAVPPSRPGGARYDDDWFHAFVARVLDRAGCPADAELVRSELAAAFTDPRSYRVYDDVLPALRRLSVAGLRLAVVSNWSDRLPGLLAGLGLAPYFHALAVSAIVGADKPDAALFVHALAELRVPAARALHVGDRRDNDVLGARAAGLQAWLIDRSRGQVGAPDVVTSLIEVADRIGA